MPFGTPSASVPEFSGRSPPPTSTWDSPGPFLPALLEARITAGSPKAARNAATSVTLLSGKPILMSAVNSRSTFWRSFAPASQAAGTRIRYSSSCCFTTCSRSALGRFHDLLFPVRVCRVLRDLAVGDKLVEFCSADGLWRFRLRLRRSQGFVLGPQSCGFCRLARRAASSLVHHLIDPNLGQP